MDENALRTVCGALGGPRLRNLGQDREPPEKILEIYGWELSLGQTLLKPIGITEVVVRNAIDSAISLWWDSCGFSGTWTEQSEDETILTPFLHITEWRKRAESYIGELRYPTHDDIIAHTTFGTWRNMIGDPSALQPNAPQSLEQRRSWEAARARDAECAVLWREVIQPAFPFIPQTKKERSKLSPRAYIGVRLSRVSALRNRVCHWDNLISVNAERRFAEMKNVVGAVSSEVEEWLELQCGEEIRDILRRKPACPGLRNEVC